MTQSFEIVIPVRDMQRHIGPCLKSLLPQLGPNDRVTVVDDASVDNTEDVARAAGAHVISMPDPRGPYGARQFAASLATATNLLFMDARCRAQAGLIDAHRTMLADPEVALSCTNVRIVAGASLASRVAADSGLFDVESKVGVPGRIDFFPTCNLGVVRKAFVEVGGFRAMRSGGDIDLCARVQLGGYGRLAADHRQLMEWIPRDRLKDMMEQAYRYGKSGALLDRLYPPEESPRLSSAKRAWLKQLRKVAGESIAEPGMVITRVAGRSLATVQRIGYVRATRHPESMELPALIPFADRPSQ